MQGILVLIAISVTFLFLALIGARLYREVFFFEGIRFGEGFHRWLYNRWASTYDRDKKKVQRTDAALIITPLIEKMSAKGLLDSESLLLDIGTGTGRFPSALLANQQFTGRVVGLDMSSGMLWKASEKLKAYGSRAILLNHKAMPLPFPDNSIEALSCLETIELLPDIRAHLQEFNRVLRPGGVLLLSRNTGDWGTQGSECPLDIFSSRLSAAGFEDILIKPWWKWFDLVWASKPNKLPHPVIKHDGAF